jgi:hypothetical protein
LLWHFSTDILNHGVAFLLGGDMEDCPSFAISQGGAVRTPLQQQLHDVEAACPCSDVYGVPSFVIRLICCRGFASV